MTEPSLRQIAWLVARDVNRTFGGGMPAMELLRRSFTSRGWLDTQGHALLIAVSRLTPGTNLLAYCADLGWTWHRLTGACVALAAASLPGSAIVSVLAAALVRIDQWPTVRALLAAATLAASVLVFASAWQLLRPHITGPRRVWAVVGVGLAIVLHLFGLTPVRVLLGVAVWGAFTPSRDQGSGVGDQGSDGRAPKPS